MSQYRKAKGFQDITGADCLYWQKTEKIIKETFDLYSVSEIRIPILEYTEVFSRGIGEATDIVEKEMFTFSDRDSSSLTLRPEGTAGVVRAYIENGFYNPLTLRRFYYTGPMFRRERPQKGRFRQFSQAGAEYLGSASPLADAEVISLFADIFKNTGVAEDVKLEMGSVGCPTCRPSYRALLVEYFKAYAGELCEDCLRRLGTNPMRLLDCKKERCKAVSVNAPAMLNSFCSDCKVHFEEVCSLLDGFGVKYNVNGHMVRGLDYYTRTAFEMITDKLGAQNAVGGGGRYDGLVKSLGGPDISGIGFAIGLDRLVELVKRNISLEEGKPDTFLIFFEETRNEALKIYSDLRSKGLKVLFDTDGGKLKSQMKKAGASGARFALILGEDELKEGMITLRELDKSIQRQIKAVDIRYHLK